MTWPMVWFCRSQPVYTTSRESPFSTSWPSPRLKSWITTASKEAALFTFARHIWCTSNEISYHLISNITHCIWWDLKSNVGQTDERFWRSILIVVDLALSTQTACLLSYSLRWSNNNHSLGWRFPLVSLTSLQKSDKAFSDSNIRDQFCLWSS